MLSETHPLIRRALRFAALPYCYFKLVNWKECTASRFQVIKDLLYIFFRLNYFPDNYSPCRFWEKDRAEWAYYYGSSYDPWQRYHMRKNVQPFRHLNLFDDKEVCNLLSEGIDGVCIPKYYGVLSPDTDYHERISEILDEALLDRIIIKPVMGSAGQGISMAFIDNGDIKIKSGQEVYALADFKLCERCIVQEVVQQHSEVASVSPASVNTVRVVTLFTTEGEAVAISACMRFGVKGAFIDNWSAGGLVIGVDHHTGMLCKLAYDKYGNQCHEHPVSGVSFDGFQVPYWDEVVETAVKVQKACPFFKLLGMDIAITEQGPVLIEINPSTDIVMQEQAAGPLLADKSIWQEFSKYGILVNEAQKQAH